MPIAEQTITPCLLVGEGTTKKELAGSLLEVEVEEHHELASVFRIRMAIVREEDGLWTFLDQDSAKPWTKLQIKMNVGDREEDLITGYVTQIRVHIDPAEGNSYLELVGMDTSCLMSAEEVIKDWPEKSDSDIAIAIFDKYKLDYAVETVDIIHTEKMSTIIQRESDIQFLKRLARRNGCECVIVGKTGYFAKPNLTKTPLPALAAHFGKETNLTSFDATWNALRPRRRRKASPGRDARAERAEAAGKGRRRAAAAPRKQAAAHVRAPSRDDGNAGNDPARRCDRRRSAVVHRSAGGSRQRRVRRHPARAAHGAGEGRGRAVERPLLPHEREAPLQGGSIHPDVHRAAQRDDRQPGGLRAQAVAVLMPNRIMEDRTT
ncbi:MAG: hypothetical protein DMF86_24735 [Acidobacteria bacterium]|nr:MAG: hypothetical protein DMF86_24735 [Acidobacteriota bacterium]